MLVMGLNTLLSLEICWVKWHAGKSVPSSHQNSERCKDSQDVTSTPLHGEKDHAVLSPCHRQQSQLDNDSKSKLKSPHLIILWCLCASVCSYQCSSKTKKRKSIKTWASGLKTQLLLNCFVAEAPLGARKFQTKRVGYWDYMTNLSKGFPHKISIFEKYSIVLELFNEKCVKTACIPCC